MAYVSWSVVFGEQPSTAKWNILGTNDAYFDSLVGSGTAWTSYTPSWTVNGSAPSLGNGTITGKYQKFGKTVHFRVAMQTGTTTSYGSGAYRFSLPVTSFTPSVIEDLLPFGRFKIDRLGTANFFGDIVFRSGATTYYELFYSSAVGASSASGGVSNVAPYTWSTGDKFLMSGTYEAA